MAKWKTVAGRSELRERLNQWRNRTHHELFSGTPASSKIFDIAVILAILASVFVVMFESIPAVDRRYGITLLSLEWGFTVLFTIEYLLRLGCAKRPLRYALSFYGVIDLLAVIPTYVSVFLPGAQALLVIRLLRILRVFRVLRLVHYLNAGDLLVKALQASWRRILIFLTLVFALVTILGSLIYLIEGADHGFDSIPRSIYWAIVTLTTVGYGDISPQTPLGQGLAALAMITGYAIIVVTTGIFSAEYAIVNHTKSSRGGKICSRCYESEHGKDAKYCHACGTSL